MKPVIVRSGATLPLAVSGYTVTVKPKVFTTKSSPWTTSWTIPAGPFRPVETPAIVRIGPVLPNAVRGYTVTELRFWFVTKSSS